MVQWLTHVENSVFTANSAIGSDNFGIAKNGGNAFGGAICITGGTANITGSFFGAYGLTQGNTAEGGMQGGGGSFRDGSGYGGALYVAGGIVTMNADTVGNPPGAPTA